MILDEQYLRSIFSVTTYDIIVIGTGGVGSAALFHAARSGGRVLGIDRFPGGHDQGSSHGQTRIIRQAYFEHPDYVPLLRRAYELWTELETLAGRQLYFPVGLIEVGPPDGVVVPGVLESARRYGLEVESLARDAMARRFPGFHLPDDSVAVFEPRAGYLLVEACVLAHLEQAQRHGAELAIGEPVVRWQPSGSGFEVRTNGQRYYSDRLIITAGPWAGQLLTHCGLPLRVVRKHLHWYGTHDERYRADQGCPPFFYERPDGYYYGFPQLDEAGVKVAEHSGGVTVQDPLDDVRVVDPVDRTRVERFLQANLPGVTTEPKRHDVCYYTLSPDEHFLVDRHPGHAGVVFAAGLSGHGFKFASVLGETLVDLARGQAVRTPIDFLRLSRLSPSS